MPRRYSGTSRITSRPGLLGLAEEAEALALDAQGDVELAAVVATLRNPAYVRIVPLQNAANRGTIRNPAATCLLRGPCAFW